MSVITENTLANQRILALFETSRIRTENIINDMPILVGIVGLDGKIFRGNKALADLYHIRQEALINDVYLPELFEKDSWEILNDRIEKIGRIKDIRSRIELPINRICDKKNVPLTFIWNISFFTNIHDSDEPLFLVTGEEVTELKAKQVELSYLNSHLESIVEERTKQLNEAYKTILKEARETGKMEILIDIMHLIGNISTSIKTSTSTFLQTMEKDQITALLIAFRKKVSSIIESVENVSVIPDEIIKIPMVIDKFISALSKDRTSLYKMMLKVDEKVTFINKFLSSQIQEKNVPVYLENAKIFEIVDYIVKKHEDICELKSITVESEIQDDIIGNVNQSKLGYVVNQMIENAIEAIVQKGNKDGHIRIKWEDDDANISLFFEDNGIGIPEDKKVTVFTPSNMSNFNQSGKLGIGLHQSFNFMSEINGHISLEENTEDGYTRFKLQIKKAV